LLGRDPGAAAWIARHDAGRGAVGTEPRQPGGVQDPRSALIERGVAGDADGAPRLVDAVIAAGLDAHESWAPCSLRIQRLRRRVRPGEVFLLQLIGGRRGMKRPLSPG